MRRTVGLRSPHVVAGCRTGDPAVDVTQDVCVVMKDGQISLQT